MQGNLLRLKIFSVGHIKRKKLRALVFKGTSIY